MNLFIAGAATGLAVQGNHLWRKGRQDCRYPTAEGLLELLWIDQAE